ncbi:MAG: HU family DNA-binding protein [Anaerolineales bacterium]
MTVKFNIVPKKDPRNLEAPPKYYPTVVSQGHADLRAIAERITGMSTVSSVDTMAVLEAFLTVIPQELAEGNIVELGELGSFRLTALASGEARPEDVSKRNIKEVKVRFKPGKLFKQVLKGLEFRKV